MLLLIDMGNTNGVFAVYDAKGAMACKTRMHTVAARCSDEYEVFLDAMLRRQSLSFDDITDVVVSSVVPETNAQIHSLCENAFGLEPVFISKDNVGIDIVIERPGDVGADRLVNALAAKTHWGTPSIVVDFGTSTNFDIINADGAFCGGVLAPGVQLSIDALHKAASKLPKVSIEKPPAVIGQSTVHAMRSGVFHGYKGLIENIVGGIREELNADAKVIATGGLAHMFEKECPCIDQVDPYLTLKGLYEVYKGLK